jgi:hypothetical protein
MRILAVIAIAAACSSSRAPIIGDDDDTPDAANPPQPDAPPQIVDEDQDGLDDAFELQVANDYLPYVAVDPGDGCALDGIIARVRPHPADPSKILIVYDHLFQNDCGLGGHIGDDEVFSIAIDPNVPPPAGILAIKAISHQGTPCERDSECATCSGDSRSPCDLGMINGLTYPVVYASKDKHGQYATKSSCGFGTCFDSCTLAPAPVHPPIVNAGEPDHPITSNLTTQGFITPANGWTETSLMNVDPWAAGDFGGAGSIAGDLVDPAFEVMPCGG